MLLTALPSPPNDVGFLFFFAFFSSSFFFRSHVSLLLHASSDSSLMRWQLLPSPSALAAPPLGVTMVNRRRSGRPGRSP